MISNMTKYIFLKKSMALSLDVHIMMLGFYFFVLVTANQVHTLDNVHELCIFN